MMPLVELHEEDPKRKGEPVFVNSSFVTFIQKSPTSSGSIVGLVGDDLGCVVRESVRDVARLVAEADKTVLSSPWQDIVPQPVELNVEEVENDHAKYVMTHVAKQSETDEVRKPRKTRKWHSRKPFNKDGE